ncbi:MAG TPA: SRPBCC family protein [Acidobacteriaceae bacterium]|nr:SRPBCC family protein [Acidobacteriaceae bacterium]
MPHRGWRVIQLDTSTIIAAPVARCFDLARSVEVHLAGNTHFSEEAVAESGASSGLLTLGDKVTWRARHFFIRQRLTSQITAFKPPHYFQDTMLRGAFRSMQHDHHFRTLPDGTTEMRDLFRFSAPIPLLGLLAEQLILRRYMQALLDERNAVIKQIAESDNELWQQYLPAKGATSCES